MSRDIREISCAHGVRGEAIWRGIYSCMDIWALLYSGLVAQGAALGVRGRGALGAALGALGCRGPRA